MKRTDSHTRIRALQLLREPGIKRSMVCKRQGITRKTLYRIEQAERAARRRLKEIGVIDRMVRDDAGFEMKVVFIPPQVCKLPFHEVENRMKELFKSLMGVN